MPAQLVALNEGPNILLDKPILLFGRHPPPPRGPPGGGGGGADAPGRGPAEAAADPGDGPGVVGDRPAQAAAPVPRRLPRRAVVSRPPALLRPLGWSSGFSRSGLWK